MAQQEIKSDQIENLSIIDDDIAADADISEGKISFETDGHDHDLVGKPTLGVILAKRLMVTPSAVPNLRVQVLASNGVNFPNGVSPDIATQQYNFTPIMPVGADKRIDLLYVDSNAFIQRRIGVVHPTTPVAPSHAGVLPLAEIGPLTATTTAITESLIKDVRPFLQPNSAIEAFDSGSLGFVSGVEAGANIAFTVTAGVLTIDSTAVSGSTVVDATTTAKGITTMSVAPAVSSNPIALGVNDPRVTLATNSLQKDGSVALEGNLDLDGNSLHNVDEIHITGPLEFSGAGNITSGTNSNITIAPAGTGKVIVDSDTAIQLPNISGTPPMPGLGDIWFDTDDDTINVRTIAGIKSMALTQVGVLGLGINEFVGDDTNPPNSGSVGHLPTLDFPNDGVTHTIYFAFQLPEDIVLTEDITLRLNFAGGASGAGAYKLAYSYIAVANHATLIPGSNTGSGSFTLTPVSSAANIFEYNESIVIAGGTLLAKSQIIFTLSRVSGDGADTKNADFKLLNIVVLYSKRDIASERNVVEITDETTNLGQAGEIKFVGNLVTATMSSGVATVTINDISLNKATTSSHGIVRLGTAPVDSAQAIAAGVNDLRFPTSDEKDAMQGSSGTPSASNRFITEDDGLVLTADQGDALEGTSGTPAADNKFVTDEDPRLPTVNEKAALAGSGSSGPGSGNKYILENSVILPTSNQKAGLAGSGATGVSGSNKYVLQDNTVLPTQSENDALVGTSGSPSSSNKYVTNSDGRLLTTDQDDALVGTDGTPSAANKFVTDSDPRLPSTDEKDALVGSGVTAASSSNKYVLEDNILLLTSAQDAALVGTTGTPGSGNKFVTSTDPRIPLQGENDALQGTTGTPDGSTNRFVTSTDTRIPLQAENDALIGTTGTASSSNKYVTDSDPRVPTVNENNALIGTSGTPAAGNPFVTDADTRIPTQSENDALQGNGASGPSNSNRYILANNVRLLTTDEKDAVVGSYGSPSASNRFVTEADPLLPTNGEKAALAGIGTLAPSGGNKYVLQDNTVLPTQGENDALVGTSGTPGTLNKFVTNQDTRVPTQGENDALQGSSGTPSSSNKFVTENDTLWVKTDGSRGFTAPQPGQDPIGPTHLTTKSYVDLVSSSLGGQYGAHVSTLSELRAIPAIARVDKQLRLVEAEGAIYRFDMEASGGGEPPNAGPGQWFKVQAATQTHNNLLGLQGGTGGEYYHLDNGQINGLTGATNTTLHFHTADRVTVKRNTVSIVANSSTVNFSTAFTVAASGSQADVGIAYGTPVTISIANSAGSAVDAAKSDHVHAHGTFASGDNHSEYSKADGTRAFTGVVVGVTPTLSAHLATKGYIDTSVTGMITGSLTSGQLPYATGSSTIASTPLLKWNNSTNIFTVGNATTGQIDVNIGDVIGDNEAGIRMIHGISGIGGSGILLQNTLSADTATSMFIVPTAAAAASSTKGLVIFATPAGSDASTGRIVPLDVTLSSGYTGTGDTLLASLIHTCAATGGNTVPLLTGVASGQRGNVCLSVITTETTTSVRTGLDARSGGAGNGNTHGIIALAQGTGSGYNVGVTGVCAGAGSGAKVAGYFTLGSSTTISTSAAVLIDNGAIAASPVIVRDNGTVIYEILDGGNQNFYGHEATRFVFENQTTDPATNLVEGRVFWDTNDDLLRVYNGSGWVSMNAAQADASTTVKGLTKLSVAPASAANPIAYGANDTAVTRADGTVPFTATVGGVTPIAGSDLATKTYVDSAVVGGGSGSVNFIHNDFSFATASNFVNSTTTKQLITTKLLAADGAYAINDRFKVTIALRAQTPGAGDANSTIQLEAGPSAGIQIVNMPLEADGITARLARLVVDIDIVDLAAAPNNNILVSGMMFNGGGAVGDNFADPVPTTLWTTVATDGDLNLYVYAKFSNSNNDGTNMDIDVIAIEHCRI